MEKDAKESGRGLTQECQTIKRTSGCHRQTRRTRQLPETSQ